MPQNASSKGAPAAKTNLSRRATLFYMVHLWTMDLHRYSSLLTPTLTYIHTYSNLHYPLTTMGQPHRVRSFHTWTLVLVQRTNRALETSRPTLSSSIAHQPELPTTTSIPMLATCVASAGQFTPSSRSRQNSGYDSRGSHQSFVGSKACRSLH